MTEQSLTLYQISTQLLELMEFREDLLSGSAYADNEVERRESIEETEKRIAEYIAKEVQKVDGIAGMLREFDRRADIEKEEAARITARAKRWTERKANLEARCIEVMQATGKDKLEGQHNTLALRKNNPAVDIVQPELVPEEFQKITVTFPLVMWNAFLEEHDQEKWVRELWDKSKKESPQPSKAEIARVLKSTEPCGKCEGRCWIEDVEPHPVFGDQVLRIDCDQCGGSGKVARGVPGARLVQSQRLEVK